MLNEKVEKFLKKYRGNVTLYTDCILDVRDIVSKITKGKPLSAYISAITIQEMSATQYMFLEELSYILDNNEYRDISKYLSIIDNNERKVTVKTINLDIKKSLNSELLSIIRLMSIQEVINLIEILNIINNSMNEREISYA